MVNNDHLPEGWRWVRLDDIADVVGGSTPARDREDLWGGTIPWVVPSEVTGLAGRHLTSANETITEAGMKSAGLQMIPAGSVLLTSRATVGVATINTIPVVTNQGFQSLLVRDGTDGLWLYYCVSFMRSHLERRAAGSTFLEVSRDSVRSLPILLPPLSEQRAIAAVLEAIDEAIDHTAAVIAANDTVQETLQSELLARGIPGWHDEWKNATGIGEMPADWELVRLGDVAEVNPKRPRLDISPESPVTFLPMASIGENGAGIVEPESREFRDVAKGFTYFEENDVLFAKITPCLQNGKHALATGLTAGLGFGTTEFHVVRAGPKIEHSHLLRVLTRPANIEKCVRSFSGTAGQQRVHPEILRSLPVLLPPLTEQQAVAALLDSVDEQMRRIQGERDALALLRTSVTAKLLSGSVRVPLQL